MRAFKSYSVTVGSPTMCLGIDSKNGKQHRGSLLAVQVRTIPGLRIIISDPVSQLL